jgi:hypothetical protein
VGMMVDIYAGVKGKESSVWFPSDVLFDELMYLDN